MSIDLHNRTARGDFQSAFAALAEAHQGVEQALSQGIETAVCDSRRKLSRALDHYLFALTSYSAVPEPSASLSRDRLSKDRLSRDCLSQDEGVIGRAGQPRN